MLAILLVSWQTGINTEPAEAQGALRKICWSSNPKAVSAQGYKWIEFFAGQSAATRMIRFAGWKGARLDINYMRPRPGKMNPMDLTTSAGMAPLSSIDFLQSKGQIKLTPPLQPS